MVAFAVVLLRIMLAVDVEGAVDREAGGDFPLP